MNRSVVCVALLSVVACNRELPSQPRDVSKNVTAQPMQMPPDPFGWPLIDGNQNRVGTIFTKVTGNDGILVSLDTSGLPAGTHPVRVHKNAKCDAPDFTTAGPPLASDDHSGERHGVGTLTVGEDHQAQASFPLQRERLNAKTSGPFALIIHESRSPADTRLACGLFYIRND